jgi:uncharacterized membrane protein YciS (DUF1049 family)
VNGDGPGESDKKSDGRSYLGGVTKFFLGPAIKQLSHLVVTFFLAVCGIGLFILLQSVCKPYWMLGTVTPAGVESFQTLFIVNPGPWKNRDPQVEFPINAGVKIVGWSGGVSVGKTDNKIFAKFDNGLPAGNLYYITYQFSSVPGAEPQPVVMCDGKVCKNSPTFDLNLTLMLLLFSCGFCLIACFFITIFYIKSMFDIRDAKQTVVHRALQELFNERRAEKERQSDISKTMETVSAIIEMQKEGTIQIQAESIKPKGKKNHNH